MLFPLFVVVPIVELYLLLAVGGRIGFWPTIGIVIGTAALGSWSVRRQGLQLLARLRQELEFGRVPGKELVEGLLVAASGLLLLTPGFLTDIVGFSLLIPPIRAQVRVLLIERFRGRIVTGHHGPGGFSQHGQHGYRDPRASDLEIIDHGDPSDPDTH